MPARTVLAGLPGGPPPLASDRAGGPAVTSKTAPGRPANTSVAGDLSGLENLQGKTS